MRKIIPLFITVMLVFSITACTSSTENTTPTDVQETTEITTTVTTENEKKPAPKNDNYLLYQKINYFPNGEIAYKVDYAYSKDYKLSQIQEIMYNPGYIVLSKIITTFEQYDANGNPTAGYIYDTTAGYYSNFTCSYDENGNLLYMERYKNERIDESKTCTYNEYGDLETVTMFLDGAGDYTTTYTYKYENSRKIKQYSANNKLTESYEYNNDGLLVKSQSYNFDGEPSGWTDYVYAIKKTITPSSSDNTTSQNTTPSIKINYNRNLKAEDYMNMPLSQLTNMYGNNYSTYQKNSTYVCYDDAIHFHLDENNVIKCVSVDENVCGITEYNIEIGKTTIYDIETLTNGDYTYNDVEINDMYEDQYLLVINDGEFMWYIDFDMNGVCISAFVKVSDIPVEKTAQTYQEKIEEYRTAITMSEEYFENEYDYGSDYRFINSLMVKYARYYDGEIYYTEYDIDNNGVSELIFSYQRKGEYSNTNEIIDIYTINNNGVVTKLFKNCYFGEKDRIHILPSGRLLNEGSSGAYSGSCSLYDIDTATGKVINSSNYYYDGNGPSSYYADYTYLSKEEYLDLLDSLGEYVFETLTWTKL